MYNILLYTFYHNWWTKIYGTSHMISQDKAEFIYEKGFKKEGYNFS